MFETVDVLILGAGAAGLMCAIEAGKRNRSVVVLDHSDRPGKKLLVTGGGRCNFTNRNVSAGHYLSHNPHFCKSALSRFGPGDFLELIRRHRIPFHEREHGQLFCDRSARDILDMLLAEAERAGVKIQTKTEIRAVEKNEASGYRVATSKGGFRCQSLVVATGGLSYPGLGASPLGYRIAGQFGINVWPTHAGLVPLTLQPADRKKFSSLSGITVECIVSTGNQRFQENLLFSHRGLSGPAILQISSYWNPGEAITINLLPDLDLADILVRTQTDHPRRLVKSVLAGHLPKRVIAALVDPALAESPMASLSMQHIERVADSLHRWAVKPGGTEGCRTAEVTVGGVDCDALSSKTMECREVPGLYFIGEVVDVTGWLGGYNLQWAWSSGWCAGQHV